MTDFVNKSVLSAKALSKSEIEKIMEVAKGFLPYARKEKSSDLLKGKVLASLFYEPSTRTRLSFEAAMQRLGGSVVTVTGMESSSLKKGESLSDTARVIENYADVFAVRHGQPGAPGEMAAAVKVPVLNAGDGPHEHPTQALLDIFTMQQEKGAIDGLKIAMVGDLKFGRTVHSLCYLLRHYKVSLLWVSPEGLKMPVEMGDDMKEHGVVFREMEKMEDALAEADICYMTRIQEERFEDPLEYEKFKGYYVLTRKMIEELNPKLTVMHPLPRVGEIAVDVDDMPGAAYFRQMMNGVAVRMALLALVLGKAGTS